MNITSLLNLFRRPAPVPTVKQNSRRALIIRKLMRQGRITVREIIDMGDNSPTNTIYRMRRDGVLYADPDDKRGFYMNKNRHTKTPFKVYIWTGSVPHGWPKPVERRSKKRGGR